MKHFNNLTPAETERLSILAEECAEVIQIVGKILRHGYNSYNPDDPKKKTNRSLLEKEIGDVQWIIEYMCDPEQNDIKSFFIRDRKLLKNINIQKYLHHQNERKTQ